MATILTAKKLSYVQRLRSAGVQTLESLIVAEVVTQGFVDSGFDQGANVLTDAEVQASNPDLTAQDVLNAANAYAAIVALLASNNRAHYKALEKMRG